MIKKFSYDEIAEICSELKYLIHSGISNSGAFASLVEDTKDTSYEPIIKKMSQQADDGMLISAIFKDSGYFPDYVCEMLSVGENSGKVEETLDAIANECASRASLDRQLKSALLYPAVLMIIMLAVIAVLLIKVLPIFDEVYAQLGSGLTGVASTLLVFGQSLSSVVPVLMVLLFLVVAFLCVFASSSSFRTNVLNFWWGIRGDKGVGGQICSAHFSQALSIAISSGMRNEDALSAAIKLLPSTPAFARKCETALGLISSGASLTEALKDSSLLPASKCRQLDAAMKAGSGDQAIISIAKRISEDSSMALNESISRIEPIIVTISSLLIGVILLVVMLPLINIMSALG